MTTLLYLLRHGEADHDSAEPGLTPRGQLQAQAVGERLRAVRFEAIEHSPLRRARQTAHLVARSLPGVPVRPSEYLRDLAPVPGPDEAGQYPADRQAWLDSVPDEERDPGAVRLRAAVQHYTADRAAEPAGSAAADQERRLLLITHAFVVGWFARHTLDAPVWRWLGLNSANTGLTIIRVSPGRPLALVTFNDTGHLPSALP